MPSHAAGGGGGRNRRSSGRAGSGERGAVAVEFALVLPVLVMLLLGVTTAGLSFNQALAMTNGVREASRFGASTMVANTAPPYTTTLWQSWADQVITRTRETMTDGSSSQVTVCVQVWKNSTTAPAAPVAVLATPRCSVGSQSLAGGSAPTPPQIGAASCVIAVWGVRSVNISALLLEFNPSVRRESIARYERSC